MYERIFGNSNAAQLGDDPRTALSAADLQLIDRARHAANGAKFERLWGGNWKGDYPSQSEADLALCSELAFWTEGDAPQIDRLFRHSGLYRKKWERADYREKTVRKACKKDPALQEIERRSDGQSTGLPWIQVNDRQLREVTADALRAI